MAAFQVVAAHNRQSARIGFMFRRLTGQRRFSVASLLVALYALCLVAPTAVIALNASPAAAHCLTDSNHGRSQGQSDRHAGHDMGENHNSSDGSNHHSNAAGDEKGQPGQCCGLFCVSAMVTGVDFIAWQHPPVTHIASLFVESLSGQDSDRIDRPPRSLLSL
jgi:hypothetical protein